ncbi:MAG: NYN domain-containing protein [Ktedonobacterales bacterium]
MVFVGAGLLSIGVAYAPDAWISATQSAFASLPSMFAAFGGRPVVLAAAAASFAVGAVVFAAARPRRHRYDVSHPDLVAPVSVYLDAENQLLSPQKVRAFIYRLRQHLGGRRADLIYYADAGAAAHTPAYLLLYRFGFRPVDVPHTPVGVGSAKNIVDVELALHAYQRALLGPPQQEVILVSADRDYLPLIYRLRAMELKVGVWADTVPAAFKDLKEYLGIQVVEFGAEPETKDKQPAGGGTSESPGNLQAASQPATLPTAIQGIDTLAQAVSLTLELIQAVSRPEQTAEERFELVKRWSSLPQHDVARMIGYPTKNRAVLWLAHLRALGIVSGGPTTTPLSPGPVAAEGGVKLLERFLHELRATAERLTIGSEGRRVKLTTLCRHVARQAPAFGPDDPLKGLRKHLRSSRARNPAICVPEMQGLCRLSKLLGVLWFDETASPNVIVVLLPRSG